MAWLSFSDQSSRLSPYATKPPIQYGEDSWNSHASARASWKPLIVGRPTGCTERPRNRKPPRSCSSTPASIGRRSKRRPWFPTSGSTVPRTSTAGAGRLGIGQRLFAVILAGVCVLIACAVVEIRRLRDRGRGVRRLGAALHLPRLERLLAGREGELVAVPDEQVRAECLHAQSDRLLLALRPIARLLGLEHLIREGLRVGHQTRVLQIWEFREGLFCWPRAALAEHLRGCLLGLLLLRPAAGALLRAAEGHVALPWMLLLRHQNLPLKLIAALLFIRAANRSARACERSEIGRAS